jgi:hypothetical protein
MCDQGEAAADEPFAGVRTSDGVIPDLFPLRPAGHSFDDALAARAALLGALSPAERAAAEFPIDSRNWRRWCNIHRYLMRHGVLLEELGPDPRERVFDLLRCALSDAGFGAARDVMRLNQTIQEISGRLDEDGLPECGEWMYWISLMGQPSQTAPATGGPSESAPWGWQLDGHHLNVNCVMVGADAVVTPFFLGSEPVVAEIGSYKGVRVLEAEEQVALGLIGSLDARQRARAVLSEAMPPGLFTGAFSDNVVLDYEGIAFGDLTTPQQGRLLELIGVYVGRLADDLAAAKMAEVREHLRTTHLCWMGGTTAESVFYYRVQSPVILLEFDHEPGIVLEGAEPMKSHIHTMMRTPNGNDYGADYLRQHRATHPHHAGS